jgi:hypothetical protein
MSKDEELTGGDTPAPSVLTSLSRPGSKHRARLDAARAFGARIAPQEVLDQDKHATFLHDTEANRGDVWTVPDKDMLYWKCVLKGSILVMGGDPSKITDDDVRAVANSYYQSHDPKGAFRFFHVAMHPIAMAGDVDPRMIDVRAFIENELEANFSRDMVPVEEDYLQGLYQEAMTNAFGRDIEAQKYFAKMDFTALHHDIVYGAKAEPALRKVLEKVFTFKDVTGVAKLEWNDAADTHCPLLKALLAKIGQSPPYTDPSAPFTAQNEILSAIVAAVNLEKSGLPKAEQLAQLATIISTIPFQSENRDETVRRAVADLAKEIMLQDAGIPVQYHRGAVEAANQLAILVKTTHDLEVSAVEIGKTVTLESLDDFGNALGAVSAARQLAATTRNNIIKKMVFASLVDQIDQEKAVIYKIKWDAIVKLGGDVKANLLLLQSELETLSNIYPPTAESKASIDEAKTSVIKIFTEHFYLTATYAVDNQNIVDRQLKIIALEARLNPHLVAIDVPLLALNSIEERIANLRIKFAIGQGSQALQIELDGLKQKREKQGQEVDAILNVATPADVNKALGSFHKVYNVLNDAVNMEEIALRADLSGLYQLENEIIAKEVQIADTFDPEKMKNKGVSLANIEDERARLRMEANGLIAQADERRTRASIIQEQPILQLLESVVGNNEEVQQYKEHLAKICIFENEVFNIRADIANIKALKAEGLLDKQIEKFFAPKDTNIVTLATKIDARVLEISRLKQKCATITTRIIDASGGGLSQDHLDKLKESIHISISIAAEANRMMSHMPYSSDVVAFAKDGVYFAARGGLLTMEQNRFVRNRKVYTGFDVARATGAIGFMRAVSSELLQSDRNDVKKVAHGKPDDVIIYYEGRKRRQVTIAEYNSRSAKNAELNAKIDEVHIVAAYLCAALTTGNELTGDLQSLEYFIQLNPENIEHLLDNLPDRSELAGSQAEQDRQNMLTILLRPDDQVHGSGTKEPQGFPSDRIAALLLRKFGQAKLSALATEIHKSVLVPLGNFPAPWPERAVQMRKSKQPILAAMTEAFGVDTVSRLGAQLGGISVSSQLAIRKAAIDMEERLAVLPVDPTLAARKAAYEVDKALDGKLAGATLVMDLTRRQMENRHVFLEDDAYSLRGKIDPRNAISAALTSLDEKASRLVEQFEDIPQREPSFTTISNNIKDKRAKLTKVAEEIKALDREEANLRADGALDEVASRQFGDQRYQLKQQHTVLETKQHELQKRHNNLKRIAAQHKELDDRAVVAVLSPNKLAEEEQIKIDRNKLLKQERLIEISNELDSLKDSESRLSQANKDVGYAMGMNLIHGKRNDLDEELDRLIPERVAQKTELFALETGMAADISTIVLAEKTHKMIFGAMLAAHTELGEVMPDVPATFELLTTAANAAPINPVLALAKAKVDRAMEDAGGIDSVAAQTLRNFGKDLAAALSGKIDPARKEAKDVLVATVPPPQVAIIQQAVALNLGGVVGVDPLAGVQRQPLGPPPSSINVNISSSRRRASAVKSSRL